MNTRHRNSTLSTFRTTSLKKAIASISRDVVRTLATRFNMGGLYAEEVCLRAHVAKDKTSVTSDEVHTLYEALRAVFDPLRSSKLKPHIVCEHGSVPIDVLPFEVSQFERYEKRYSQVSIRPLTSTTA